LKCGRPVSWEMLGSVTFSLDSEDPTASQARGLHLQEATDTHATTETLSRQGNASTHLISISAVFRPSNHACLMHLVHAVSKYKATHHSGFNPQHIRVLFLRDS
jgi:hypothetical protein